MVKNAFSHFGGKGCVLNPQIQNGSNRQRVTFFVISESVCSRFFFHFHIIIIVFISFVIWFHCVHYQTQSLLSRDRHGKGAVKGSFLTPRKCSHSFSFFSFWHSYFSFLVFRSQYFIIFACHGAIPLFLSQNQERWNNQFPPARVFFHFLGFSRPLKNTSSILSPSATLVPAWSRMVSNEICCDAK